MPCVRPGVRHDGGGSGRGRPDPGPAVIHVVVTERLEVGRECDGLIVADAEVSRRHASLTPDGAGLVIDDLGSTNGTQVNGHRLAGPTPLQHGDVARLGSTEIEVVDSVGMDDFDPRSTTVTSAAVDPRGTALIGARGRAGGRGDDIRRTSIELVAAEVQHDAPRITTKPGEGDTLTIAFSDIESSTQRAVALGDERWFKVLGQHNRIVRDALQKWGGTEIKAQGDGFMVTFPSARRAVQCFSEVQRQLTQHAEGDPDQGVRIRVGLHTGEAIVDADGDLFGKHIIVAARIANLAAGGEILVSHVVKEITSSRGDLSFGDPQDVELKGIDGDYTVYPRRLDLRVRLTCNARTG